MLSNRLSRWTLLFFAVALANFLAAQAVAIAGLTWPLRPIFSPGTLVAVHLLGIGWLLLLMLGALLQFVPVITSHPLASQPLALATLVAIESGLLAMVAGFVGISGAAPVPGLFLPAGGAAVLIGVLGACLNIGAPLVRPGLASLPRRMVLSGLVFLLLAVLLGFCFALALTVPALAPFLAPLLAAVGDHALAALGGWFTLTAMGVAYKLLPMFMLAPEERGIVGDGVHGLGTAGFALALAAGLVRIWAPGRALAVIETIGYAAIAIAVVVFLWDVRRLYRTRVRSVIEAHNKAAIGAFGYLALATALAAECLARGRLAAGAPVIVFLAVYGWLGGLGLTQLYKIVPFLAWLARYGGSLGRAAVPRVQDLVKEQRSYPWFAVYFSGVLLAAAAALSAREFAFQPGLALAALATAGLVVEYWRAWRGYYVRLRPVAPGSFPSLASRRNRS